MLPNHRIATIKDRGSVFLRADDVVILLYSEAAESRRTNIEKLSTREKELVALVLEALAERIKELS